MLALLVQTYQHEGHCNYNKYFRIAIYSALFIAASCIPKCALYDHNRHTLMIDCWFIRSSYF